MEITFLGMASFKLKFGDGMILLTDPYGFDKSGLQFPKTMADIVTVSSSDKNHNNVKGIIGPVKREEIFFVGEEGEYEMGGVEVVAKQVSKDNLITVIRENGIAVCHLGNMSDMLTDKQIEKIGPIDILMLPIGGEKRLKPKDIGSLISGMSPSIAIPMFYDPKEKELEEFLNSTSLEVMLENVDKLKVNENTLPEDTKVVVFT